MQISMNRSQQCGVEDTIAIGLVLVSRNNVIPSTHKPNNNNTLSYTFLSFWIQVRE
jgi:hypothetical protein